MLLPWLQSVFWCFVMQGKRVILVSCILYRQFDVIILPTNLLMPCCLYYSWNCVICLTLDIILFMLFLKSCHFFLSSLHFCHSYVTFFLIRDQPFVQSLFWPYPVHHDAFNNAISNHFYIIQCHYSSNISSHFFTLLIISFHIISFSSFPSMSSLSLHHFLLCHHSHFTFFQIIPLSSSFPFVITFLLSSFPSTAYLSRHHRQTSSHTGQ